MRFNLITAEVCRLKGTTGRSRRLFTTYSDKEAAVRETEGFCLLIQDLKLYHHWS